MLRTLLLTVVLALPSAARTADSDPPLLTVRIFNYTQADPEVIVAAAARAARAFDVAEARTRWVLCETNVTRGKCYGWPQPDTIHMRISASANADALGLNRSVFGYALPSQTGGYGKVASAYWDRIQDAARVSGLDESDLLAAVMAHEIGHLLLGPNSHTRTGLMQSKWGAAVLDEIRRDVLHFRPSRRRAIRKAVRERTFAALAL